MTPTLPFVIHKAGKGPHHAQDLTAEEAAAAFRAVVEGEATPLQLGGFFIALRTKGETGVEIAEYAKALRRRVLRSAGAWDLDVPSYAGKSKTFRALPAAVRLMERAGVRTRVHGYDDAPGREGSAALMREVGIGFDDVRDLLPRLWELLELRKELGVRTITHVAARLLDPSAVGVHLIPITHAPYFEKYQSALEALGERGWIVMGSEGEAEAPYHGALKIRAVPGGDAVHRPEDFGLPRPRFEDVRAGTVEEEAAISRRVLAGEELPHRTLILMTAAAGIAAATGVPFTRAMEQAAQASKR